MIALKTKTVIIKRKKKSDIIKLILRSRNTRTRKKR